MYYLVIIFIFLFLIMLIRVLMHYLINRLVKAIRPKKAVVMPARVDHTAKVIHVNGFDLWYKEIGNPEGKAVIIIHGGPGLSSHYFANYLDFLEKDYRVIYYDQRGCGSSEFKSDCSLYTFDSLIEDLDVIVNDYIKEKQVVLMGHSFGATVALKYALDHAEKIEKLILISNGIIKSRVLSVIAFLFQFYKGSFPPIEDPEATNLWYQSRLVDSYRDTFYNPNNMDLIELGYPSYATMLSELKSMDNFNFAKQLTGFDKETLIIHGVKEPDGYSKRDQIFLHKALKNSTMVQFNQSGHWSFIEEPEKFQRTILNFLEK